MGTKTKKQKKTEVFKISPSGMGYVELYDNEISSEMKDALKDLVEDGSNSRGITSTSATIDHLENVFISDSPAKNLFIQIVKKAKRLGYDELTFNW